MNEQNGLDESQLPNAETELSQESVVSLNPGHTERILEIVDLLPEGVPALFFIDDSKTEIPLLDTDGSEASARIDKISDRAKVDHWRLKAQWEKHFRLDQNGNTVRLMFVMNLEEKLQWKAKIFNPENPYFSVYEIDVESQTSTGKPVISRGAEVTFSSQQLETLFRAIPDSGRLEPVHKEVIDLSHQELSNGLSVSTVGENLKRRLGSLVSGRETTESLLKWLPRFEDAMSRIYSESGQFLQLLTSFEDEISHRDSVVRRIAAIEFGKIIDQQKRAGTLRAITDLEVIQDYLAQFVTDHGDLCPEGSELSQRLGNAYFRISEGSENILNVFVKILGIERHVFAEDDN